MGEAEDIVRRRETVEQNAQRAIATAAEMAEARYIQGKLQRMLPMAMANLRKHSYNIPGSTWIDVDGERRVAWMLGVVNPPWDRETDDYRRWYLLADGVLVMQCRDTVTRVSTLPNVESLTSLHRIIIHPKQWRPVLESVEYTLRKY